MDITWDGTTRSESLASEWADRRSACSYAAKAGDWDRLFGYLDADAQLVNTTRPDGKSWYAPLHQAAHAGAATSIVERLIEKSAWRTLQNARGERPVDVAERLGQDHLLAILQPAYRRRAPMGVLLKIQSLFHDVIRGRAEGLVKEHQLRLPELEILLELDVPRLWFPVPGMYGGFSLWLEVDGVDPVLITESWCRVEGGSGQRHEISSAGSKLVHEGFV